MGTFHRHWRRSDASVTAQKHRRYFPPPSRPFLHAPHMYMQTKQLGAVLTAPFRSVLSVPSTHLWQSLKSTPRKKSIRNKKKSMARTLTSLLAISCLKPFADIFITQKTIKKIGCPLLIIHGKYDNIVPCGHGLYLYEKLKKLRETRKDTTFLGFEYHLFTYGDGHSIDMKHFYPFFNRFLTKLWNGPTFSAREARHKKIVAKIFELWFL